MPRTSHFAEIADLVDLLEAPSLEQAAPVLVPGARAASELRAAFDRGQQSLGRQAWYPAPVFSWAQWVAGLWSEIIVSGADDRILLNPAQERNV